MRLKIIRMDLPLKHVMTVFRGTISVIRTVVVELEQDGLRGYGEAYEDQHWGIAIESMVRSLEMCREKMDTCSNLYGGGTDGLKELLTAMGDIIEQKIAQQFSGSRKKISFYSAYTKASRNERCPYRRNYVGVWA